MAMRRPRNEGPKVWHNPELDTFARRRGQSAPSPEPRDSRVVREQRAALDALFAPKGDAGHANNSRASTSSRPPPKNGGRIVLAPPPQSDPKTLERQRLLAKLMAAEGRPSVTKAADEFLRAGYTFPDDQDVHRQLLEHTNEEHVRGAIDALCSLLVGELPKRRAVLESRLRRIEQFAEEAATRSAAEKLRKQVSGRA